MRLCYRFGTALSLALLTGACGGGVAGMLPTAPTSLASVPSDSSQQAPLVDFVRVSCLPAAIPVGGAIGCRAYGAFRDGTPDIDITDYVDEWRSSSPAIATVGEHGVGVGKVSGLTKIDAKYTNHRQAPTTEWWSSNFFQVGEVAPAPAGQPAVDFLTLEAPLELKVGERFQIRAFGNFQDRGKSQVDITDWVEEWSSSSPPFASVDEHGMVVGKAQGEVQINVKYSSAATGIHWSTGRFKIVP